MMRISLKNHRLGLMAILSLLLFAGQAHEAAASEPLSETENLCLQDEGGGDRVSCQNNASICDSGEVCIETASGEAYCEVSCWNDTSGQPMPDNCALGETCVTIQNEACCKPTHFRMDLNLLDKAIIF